MTERPPMTTKQTAETKVTAENIDLGLRNLRHLYEQMLAGHVRADYDHIENAARGLLGPAIENIEKAQLDRDRLADRCRELEGERDEAWQALDYHASRSPVDPSSFSLSEAECILADHIKGMAQEDVEGCFGRLVAAVFADRDQLRAALKSAERDYRDALQRIKALEGMLGEALDIAAMSLDHMDRNAEAKANRISELRKELPK